MAALDEEVDFTVVFLGKTGSGKSTLGNVVLGRTAFKESADLASATNSVQAEIAVVQCDAPSRRNIRIRVVDTIGMADTDRSEETVLNELSKISTICRGGVHCFFFVTKDRCTKEEKDSLNLLRTVILRQDAIMHTTIVRTNCNLFEQKDHVQALHKEFIRLCPELASAREYLAVDNATEISGILSWRERRKKAQQIILRHLLHSCPELFYPDPLHVVQERIRQRLKETRDLAELQREEERRRKEAKEAEERRQAAERALQEEMRRKRELEEQEIQRHRRRKKKKGCVIQ